MIIYLEAIGLKIAYRIALILAKMNVSPNAVTILRFLIAAPVSWYFFTRGIYIYNVIGLFLYMFLAIFDWVDGKLARITGKSSLVGKLIDSTTDSILVLIVLGSLFYAGITFSSNVAWVILVILFYSVYFFSTALWYEFDNTFDLELKQYGELEKNINSFGGFSNRTDEFLYSLLHVHRNSITTFCFSISYLLFLGILINQLFLTFAFITIACMVRIIGIFYIMYVAKRKKDSNLILVKVLRMRMTTYREKQEIISRFEGGVDKKSASKF